MAKQTINVGTNELAGDGESLRTAFQKINSNFNELYSTGIISTGTGFTGSQGSTGTVGFTGSQGAGFTGSRGVVGFTGSQGAGFTGSRGVVGFVGSQGIVGFTGSQGVVGLQGNVGFTGSQGIVGFTGSHGDQGLPGPVGFDGSQGNVGFTGSQGTVGFTGSEGSAGLQGNVGFTGSQGVVGSQGNVGFTGSAGVTPNFSAVGEHILPATDVNYDLGSPTAKFRSLYLSTSTIYLGTSTISISSEGQMLVNGAAATSKVEYFGTEGFGPRDSIFSAWIGSKLFFAEPGKELKQAIYDLSPGSPIGLFNDLLGLVNFTINGNAAEVIDTNVYNGPAVEIPVAELNTYTNFSPQLYLHDIYLPVKDKSATIANGTWTITVNTTGTVVFPDGSTQRGASISIADLKTLVAASTDFANFKTRIAAL